MINHKTLIGIVILSVSILIACKKEQPSLQDSGENCDCAQPVTANFFIEELATPIDWDGERKSTDSDTIYANKNVWFHPEVLNASYTWFIGAEEIEEEEVYRYFDASHIGNTYNISMVIEKEPNRICFPDDDGIDTVTRSITIVDPFDDFVYFNDDEQHKRFEGNFLFGGIEGQDSLEISIEVTPLVEGTALTNRFVIGGYTFYESLDEINFGDPAPNYRQVWLNDNYCFGEDAGIYIHDRLDNIVELKLTSKGSSCSSYHLYGRKID